MLQFDSNSTPIAWVRPIQGSQGGGAPVGAESGVRSAFLLGALFLAGCARGGESTGTSDLEARQAYAGANEDLKLFRTERFTPERLGMTKEEAAALSKDELKKIEELGNGVQAMGMIAADDLSFKAAERLFDKYPFNGMTKDEVLKLLGPPSPDELFKEEWLHLPCPVPHDGEETMNYVLQSLNILFGSSPRIYSLRLRRGKVVGVEAPPKIPKSIGVDSWGMAEEVASMASPSKKHKIRVIVLDSGATHCGNFWTFVLLSTPEGEFIVAQGLSGCDVRYGKSPFPLEWDGEDVFTVSFVKDLHDDTLTRYKVNVQVNLKKAVSAREDEKVNTYCPVTFR